MTKRGRCHDLQKIPAASVTHHDETVEWREINTERIGQTRDHIRGHDGVAGPWQQLEHHEGAVLSGGIFDVRRLLRQRVQVDHEERPSVIRQKEVQKGPGLRIFALEHVHVLTTKGRAYLGFAERAAQRLVPCDEGGVDHGKPDPDF